MILKECRICNCFKLFTLSPCSCKGTLKHICYFCFKNIILIFKDRCFLCKKLYSKWQYSLVMIPIHIVSIINIIACLSFDITVFIFKDIKNNLLFSLFSSLIIIIGIILTWGIVYCFRL
jgi:hypothetical protein